MLNLLSIHTLILARLRCNDTPSPLPIPAAHAYKATIMIGGGNNDTATAAKQGQGVVATDICASINPEDSAPTWVYEKMPSVR